jgi:hypothetical protein
MLSGRIMRIAKKCFFVQLLFLVGYSGPVKITRIEELLSVGVGLILLISHLK